MEGRTELILNEKVLDYLIKRGYYRTEAMLRTETANLDAEGRPIFTRQEETGGGKYGRSFGTLHLCSILSPILIISTGLLKVWIEENLIIYKVRFITNLHFMA